MSLWRWRTLVLLSVFLVACSTGTPTSLPTTTPGPTLAPPGASTPASLGEQGLPSVASVVEKVSPAVVSVNTQEVRPGFFYQIVVPGAGTGVIIRPDGYILTNDHVIRGAREISVNLLDGRVFPAEVVGGDCQSDLAVIKIDAQGLPTVPLGSSEELRVGDWVIALGNALGLKGGPTVTVGIVSALGRSVQTEACALGQEPPLLYDMIQTDAAINPGNSGGPLVNLKGEVVGINAAIQGNAQGIGFAISSRVAGPSVASLIDHGRVIRPLIGLGVDNLTSALASQLGVDPTTKGIVATAVSPNGPAANGGLRQGDIIVKLGGQPVGDVARFLDVLWRYRPGDTITVEFVREGKTHAAEVTLEERPPSAALRQVEVA